MVNIYNCSISQSHISGLTTNAQQYIDPNQNYTKMHFYLLHCPTLATYSVWNIFLFLPNLRLYILSQNNSYVDNIFTCNQLPLYNESNIVLHFFDIMYVRYIVVAQLFNFKKEVIYIFSHLDDKRIQYFNIPSQ